MIENETIHLPVVSLNTSGEMYSYTLRQMYLKDTFTGAHSPVLLHS